MTFCQFINIALFEEAGFTPFTGNPAKKVLQNQHAIPVTIKPKLLPNRLLICPANQLIAAGRRMIRRSGGIIVLSGARSCPRGPGFILAPILL